MLEEATVDLINNDGQAQGVMANHLQSNGNLNPGAMRPFINQKDGKAYVSIYLGGDPTKVSSYSNQLVNNATLRRDEWKSLDEAILQVSRTRLNGIQDLISNGLTYQLGNAMGTTVLEWHDVVDAFEADLTMDGVTRSKNDRPKFKHNYLPIPIIHVDYEINARVLAASRQMGNALDTTSAEMAARKVNDKLEAMLFTDTSYSFGEKDARTRNTIYSYVNHPDRNPMVLKKDWDASGTTGKEIVKDVTDMKQLQINSRHYGPYMVYIPTNYETVLDQDYDSLTPGTTIRERILKIAGIKDIKVVDTLGVDNVLMVQMTSDVVRLVQGLGIQNVQWDTEGKFVNKYKVMTIQVPQIRSDADGRSGIVHLA